MGAATGLVGGLGALARGAGAKGFGVERGSTGLAGGPVPTNFGRGSGARGFCREQGVGCAFRCAHRPVLRDPMFAHNRLRAYCPRAAQSSPGQARLTSGGKGLGVGLRGCCWSAMACRVISRAWGEVVVVTGQAPCSGHLPQPSRHSPGGRPVCG